MKPKTYRWLSRGYRVVSIIMILAMALAPTMRVNAYTYTDKPDYQPGEIVTILGDNSDGAGYIPGATLKVYVYGPDAPDPLLDYNADCTAEVSAEGTWSCQVTLSADPAIAVGTYTYDVFQIVESAEVFVESGAFTDAAPPSIQQLWQCDPPSIWDPSTYTCVSDGPTGWVSGNNDGPLYEGDTVPYRTRLQNLISGNHYTITIGWDTTKDGKHALDYLKTFNATMTNADPCISLVGLPAGLCSGTPSTWGIPADTFMQSDPEWITNGGVQDPGVFTMFGGDITGVSEYNTPASYDGNTATSITISFTAASTDIVLAWGGHIGERADWGMDNSAVFITGSPYHMHIDAWYDITNVKSLNVGEMDRSLSAEAVIYPAHVTVIKEADPQGATPFPFTGGLGDFSLIDDGTSTDRQTFEVKTFGDFAITELVPSYWQLDNIVCVDSTGEPVIDVAGATATVNILEADEITCTFYDSLQAGDITIIKQTDPDGSTQIFDFTASYDADGFSLSDGQSNFSGPLNPGTYSVAEVVPAGWSLANATCSDGSSPASIGLGAGEHITCTFTNNRLAMDLTVDKTVTASKDRLYKWLIDKSVDDTRIEIAEGGTATFNYSVKVTPDGYTDSDFVLGGTITVSNPNDWVDITLLSISDTLDQGGSCSITEGAPYIVPKGGSLVLHYTCTTDGTTTENTVNITWDKTLYRTPNGSASDKAAVSFGLDQETNKTITVIDDKTDPVNPVTLGTWDWAGGEHTFTYSLEKAGVGGKCTDYNNKAEIVETKQSDTQKVTVCVGLDLTVSKTAAGTFDRTYHWLIDKSVDDTLIEIAAGGLAKFNYTVKVTPNGYTDSGWVLGGKITVTNPNEWEDITADVTDTFAGGGVCTVTGGEDVVVPAGKSVELDYSCIFAGEPGYTGKNTATAVWDAAKYFTPTGTASGQADVVLGLKGETNRTITVVDDKTDPLNPVTLGTPDYYTGPFEYTYSLEKAGVGGKCTDYNNKAEIVETKQSDTQKVTVCVGLDLTVSKTAAATFDRTYLWDISKAADKTSVTIMIGESWTFHYTVGVWQTGIVDSNWAMSGKITVANPNDWEDITADITDVYGGGGDCTVTGGEDVVVPAGGSVELNYSCTFAAKPAYTGTNTATATWTKALYFTPNGTANGTAAVTFTQVGSTNKTIHVTDTYAGDLGTVNATDAMPWASASFTYDREIFGEAGLCTDYDNTATITETGQSADETVTVCVQYWAFTPGFWKNHTEEPRNAWKYTAYDTGDTLGEVFPALVGASFTYKASTRSYASLTLLQALSLKGGTDLAGAMEILLRAATAALLNASFHEEMHGTVEGYYPFTTAEIIALVNTQITSGDRASILALAYELDGYNNGDHYIEWWWEPGEFLP